MVNIADGATIGQKYRVINKLGFRDAGTVYRVRQLGIEVERAMKILDPKLPGVPRETFAREFTAETQTLSQLTHRNLVKLIDAGSHESDGQSFPYYVTDLVHPQAGEDTALTLEAWAREVQTREEFVDILIQLTDGLSYLHSHACLHCDIKPNNILLQPVGGNKYELKIADLGSSKILPNVQHPDTQRTHVVGTVDYAPDYVLRFINSDQTVSPSDLRAWFPHWDLFCVGSTLARIIWVESTPGERDFAKMLRNPRKNIEKLFAGDFDVLKRVILRLVDPVQSNCFPPVFSLAEAFRKFMPEYLVPLGVREMAVGGAHRALTQPLEKVYLSDRAYDLVEHPVFQRLHNLNQSEFRIHVVLRCKALAVLAFTEHLRDGQALH